ncbi:probable salivary secreted peptide [Chelonus insularis]|uniref:probable salivary secreted peptide n=1 Tax=Chelonus insularis TaxID=460826 RepID=UPI00158A4036|nr:probable salivary secreted peptide [Chelonus insularis]
MYAKCLVILSFAAALTVAAAFSQSSAYGQSYASAYAGPTNNKSHHLIAGNRLPGDYLVLRQNIIKSSSWLQIVTVEKTFNVSGFERITQVQALDQKTNGNGAYASIVKGGPGTSNVTIKFKSQRSHGINFMVLIYARR